MDILACPRHVAARLCAEAKDGQILISQRVAARLNDDITIEDIGSLALKGLMQPKIGIGGHLAVPPLPHHRAYGSRTRRFD